MTPYFRVPRLGMQAGTEIAAMNPALAGIMESMPYGLLDRPTVTPAQSYADIRSRAFGGLLALGFLGVSFAPGLMFAPFKAVGKTAAFTARLITGEPRTLQAFGALAKIGGKGLYRTAKGLGVSAYRTGRFGFGLGRRLISANPRALGIGIGAAAIAGSLGYGLSRSPRVETSFSTKTTDPRELNATADIVFGLHNTRGNYI